MHWAPTEGKGAGLSSHHCGTTNNTGPPLLCLPSKRVCLPCTWKVLCFQFQAGATTKRICAAMSVRDASPPSNCWSGSLQEVLPSLLHILAPALRPVSRQLYTPEEQQAVEVVVGALLAYGLRFAAEGEDDAEEAEGLAG